MTLEIHVVEYIRINRVHQLVKRVLQFFHLIEAEDGPDEPEGETNQQNAPPTLGVHVTEEVITEERLS